MQKVTILNGSPRKKGNTSALSEIFATGLDNSKFSVDTIFLYDQMINPCTDCRVCKNGDLVCKVNDDMRNNYAKIENSNLLVFATPIYWYTPTAKMKALIDRLRPFYGNKRLSGKKAVLITPAGVGERDCDLTLNMFQRMCRALGMESIGNITSKAYDIGESEKDETALDAIAKLVNKINVMN